MANKPDCPTPITIGGVIITPELLKVIGDLQCYSKDQYDLFLETIVICATAIDRDYHGIDADGFEMVPVLINVVKTAIEAREVKQAKRPIDQD